MEFDPEAWDVDHDSGIITFDPKRISKFTSILKGDFQLANKRTLGILGASAAMLVALTGCSQAAVAGPTHAQDASASLKRAIAAEKPLVMLPSPVGDYTDNFSPFVSNPSYTGQLGLVYQPLVYFDTLNPKPTYLLATGYKISNDGKSVTVQLRKDAKWSDGKAFTSADVVFTFNLMHKYPSIDGNGVWTTLSSISADGPHAVVLHYAKPNVPAVAFALGATILPEHQWASIKGDPSKAIIKQPIGTGPYVLKSFSPQSIEYMANMQYYLGMPEVRDVEIPAYTGNDSADLSLAKGDVQWAGIFIPSIQNVYVNKGKNNHYWFPASNVITLYPNLKTPGLNDPVVRKAMSLAIDRTQLANQGEYGYSEAAAQNDMIPSFGAWSASASLKNAYPMDVAKAQKMLEADGYKKDANGIFAKNGKELNFTLQVPAGWTDWDTDVSLMTQSITAMGIKITPMVEQQSAYFSNLFGGQHNYQLLMSWTNEGPSPYFQFQYELNSKGSFNVEQLKNSAVDAALNNFAATSSAAQQHKDLNMVQNYVVNQMPVIPLFYGPTWYEYNDSQYTGWPTASNPYINPSPYTGQAQAIVLMHLKPVMK